MKILVSKSDHSCHLELCIAVIHYLAGFPDRATRGPICYECNHVGSAAECDTVKLCSSNEVNL